jgi:hypothetical protein
MAISVARARTSPAPVLRPARCGSQRLRCGGHHLFKRLFGFCRHALGFGLGLGDDGLGLVIGVLRLAAEISQHGLRFLAQAARFFQLSCAPSRRGRPVPW